MESNKRNADKWSALVVCSCSFPFLFLVNHNAFEDNLQRIMKLHTDS